MSNKDNRSTRDIVIETNTMIKDLKENNKSEHGLIWKVLIISIGAFCGVILKIAIEVF
jgi:hypothetical protein